ncbi:MAG: SpoIIE family protein phosphatase [Rhodocyclaceae bacterium]|nr:SpoIIE family protein phosphatase [Rhodocyclaceae bacterium]
MSPPADAPPSSHHVLVVDDTATNRQILAVFLKKMGHTVDLAEDGAKAVAMFAARPYDLVIMDVMMPVMDGYEATRRIKAMCGERWVPVIFLSALDKDENLVAGLEAGGDDYLAKPVNFVVLEAKLRSLSRALLLRRELEDARRFSQAVTDNLLDAVVTIDEHGRIEAVNPACCHIFGYAANEMIGQNISLLMPEPYASRHDGYIRAYLAGGAPKVIGTLGCEVEGRRKDGSVFPLALSVSEFRDQGRRMFVGALRDITREKEAERRLRETAQVLQLYHDEREAENRLAAEILDQLLQRPGLADPRLKYWMAPAEAHFSGDIIAAARAANGRYYVLLADATGHGLAAAICVLPLLTQFYDSAGAGVPLSRIIHRINTQLNASLPVGRFVAATFVCLDETGSASEIWVGGLPAAHVIGPDGRLLQTLESVNLPLGIEALSAEAVQTVPLAGYPPGAQLMVYSDGLVEAQNAQGEAFGLARLLACLADVPPQARLDAVKDAMLQHLGEMPAHDDMTVLFLDLPTLPTSRQESPS